MAHEATSEESATRNGCGIADPKAPAIAPNEPAASVIHAALVRGVQRMRVCDPEARRGDVEGVHRMRTTTRRLRSELRLFHDLVDPSWSQPLEAELKWLADRLGAVRDLDVLQARLLESAGPLRNALAPLFAALGGRHASASGELRDAFRGERFRALLDRLDAASVHPALEDEAWEPCRSALPPLVAATWSKLKTRGRALADTAPDEEFHEVRKRAKRARYAAEAVADALDDDASEDAKHFAKLATRVQDVLGEHQDAVIAAREIERIAADHPDDGPFNLAAGRLLERQESAAEEARARFFGIWDKLDRKKVRRWFHP